MDNHVYSPFIQCFPVDLVITRYPEILSVVPRILWAYCLAVLVTWIPLRIILALTEYPVIPSWFKYSTIVFKILFDLPKILRSLLLLKFLFACIMVNPISLVILLASLVIIILSPLIQYVANARNPQSDPRIHPSGSDVVLFMNWFSPIKLSSIVPLSLLDLSILDQSICFWSFVLETIISFYLSIRLIRWFLNLMPLSSFFLWVSTDTHISFVVDRPIHCWIVIR